MFSDEANLFDQVRDISYRFADKYNFQSLHLPILEDIDLFVRNLGEESDIISKEIYSLQTKGGDILALRPEFTASVSRFFVEKGLYKKAMPQKFFSFGPLFRYDRPQKGRYRQFNQFNFEIFGAGNDFNYEVFSLFIVVKFLQEFNINIGQDWVLKINFLGDESIREAYKECLVKKLNSVRNKLSETSQKRLDKNPLRILDSKELEDIEIISNIPDISNFYTEEYRQHVSSILDGLSSTNINKSVISENTLDVNNSRLSSIPFEIDHTLVRGLDYYDGLVFEVCNKNKNVSQNAILGGGKYARLVKDVSDGLSDVAAIGFAAGVERIMDIFKESLVDNKDKNITVYLVGPNNKISNILSFANSLDSYSNINIEVSLKDYGDFDISANQSQDTTKINKKIQKALSDAKKRGNFDYLISFFTDQPMYKNLKEGGGNLNIVYNNSNNPNDEIHHFVKEILFKSL